MRTTAFALLAAAIAASAVCAQVASAQHPPTTWLEAQEEADGVRGSLPFKYCSKGVATVDSIDITGTIAPGKTVGIDVKAKLSKEEAGGSFKLQIFLLGIPVVTKQGNICDNPYLHTKCPVPAGPVLLSGKFAIPGIAPPGTYPMKVQVKGKTGDDIACVELTVTVGKGDSDATSIDELMTLPAPQVDEGADVPDDIGMRGLQHHYAVTLHQVEGNHCTELLAAHKGRSWYHQHDYEFKTFEEGRCPHRFNFWNRGVSMATGVWEHTWGIATKSDDGASTQRLRGFVA